MSVHPPAATSAGQPPYPQSPVIETNTALVCLVVNVVLPGIGTIIAGVVGNRPLIGRGIAQILLTLVFVGWVWAIITGVQLLQNATWAQRAGVRIA